LDNHGKADARANINSKDDTSLTLASRLALAKYFDQARREDLATTEYLDVVKVASDNLVARRQLARIYTSEQRFPEAYDQLTALRSLSPKDPQVAEDFADVAARLGRSSEAIKAYREASSEFRTKKDRKRVERSLKSVGGN
jgi:predicted negative regulator of RcsB-dependent stress response